MNLGCTWSLRPEMHGVRINQQKVTYVRTYCPSRRQCILFVHTHYTDIYTCTFMLHVRCAEDYTLCTLPSVGSLRIPMKFCGGHTYITLKIQNRRICPFLQPRDDDGLRRSQISKQWIKDAAWGTWHLSARPTRRTIWTLIQSLIFRTLQCR